MQILVGYFSPLLKFSGVCVILGLKKALVDGETLKHAERWISKVLDLTHPSSVSPPFPVPRRDQQDTQSSCILFIFFFVCTEHIVNSISVEKKHSS